MSLLPLYRGGMMLLQTVALPGATPRYGTGRRGFLLHVGEIFGLTPPNTKMQGPAQAHLSKMSADIREFPFFAFFHHLVNRSEH